MKKLIFGVFFLAAPVFAVPKIAVTVSNGALQSGTTTGFNVSSGTVKNFNASTATIKNSLTSPAATITDLNATNATIGTLGATTLSATALSATALSATTLALTNLAVTTATWKGFGILPILQIQQTTLNSAQSVTSTSFSSVLSLSITPKISTSKIMVLGTGNLACAGAGVCYGSLYRDSTNLASSTGGFGTLTANGNNHLTMLYYDSPGTTSSTAYTIRTRVNGGGVTAIMPGTDGGIFTTTATLLLVEVAQ